MNTDSTNPNEGLLFNTIKSGRHSASGILADENGNVIELEVRGTSREYVEKFVDYQLVKKKGNGISTSIKPLSAKEKSKLKKAKRETRKKKKNVKKSKLYSQKSWHGLSVAINVKELKDESSDPQKIHIVIDPVIEPGNSKQMNFTIFGQEIANIDCTVTNGRVTCELFEFTDSLRTQSMSRAKAEHVVTSKKFDIPQSKTEGRADWNFRVIGELTSTFTISLDLTVF